MSGLAERDRHKANLIRKADGPGPTWHPISPTARRERALAVRAARIGAMGDEHGGDGGELAQLRAAVEAAEARLGALRPSPEQLRSEAAEAERRAMACGALSPKTSQLVQSMQSRWCEFLDVHGDSYEYDPAKGPSVELAVHFQ